MRGLFLLFVVDYYLTKIVSKINKHETDTLNDNIEAKDKK